MTNKKNIASKLVLALFILTLISCCLLGSTFARYASGGSGTASVGVAKWDVTMEDATAQISVTQNKLSPLDAAWSDSSTRTHDTGKLLVATITNNSDVDALVTVTAGELMVAADAAYDGTGYVVSDGSFTGNGASVDQIKALFSIKLYTDEQNTYADGAELTSGSNFKLTAGADPIYIFAEVTWTSTDSGTNAAYADAIDTWAGKYVTSVSSTISYSAVQDSTRPTT